jgi:hypothetical protein
LPALCPQSDTIGRNSASGIIAVSISLSASVKYRSEVEGMTIAGTFIAPSAAERSPLKESVAEMSERIQVSIIERISIGSRRMKLPSQARKIKSSSESNPAPAQSSRR